MLAEACLVDLRVLFAPLVLHERGDEPLLVAVDLLVHGVGLDVLVVVVDHRAVQTQS